MQRPNQLYLVVCIRNVYLNVKTQLRFDLLFKLNLRNVLMLNKNSPKKDK